MSQAVRRQFILNCTSSARDFLLKEGTDSRCGARDLKRSIERHLVIPLSNLLATEQIGRGALVTTYYSPQTSKLMFLKEDWGALVARVQGTTGAREALALVSGVGASGCKASAVGATARIAS